MKTMAAVTYGIDEKNPFTVKEVELDDPKDDEVMVHMVAAGLCHRPQVDDTAKAPTGSCWGLPMSIKPPKGFEPLTWRLRSVCSAD